MKLIETSAGKISVRDHGSGNTTLVFLHGISLSSEMFENQLSSSLANDYRLIAIDFPGHGQSESAVDPQNVYSFKNFASVIWEILDKLCITNPILVGHSFGGNIAFEMVSGDREAAGLIVVSAFPIPTTGKGYMEGIPPDISLDFAFQETYTDEEIMMFACFATGLPEADVSEHIIDSIKRSDGRMRPLNGACVRNKKHSDHALLVKTYANPIATIIGDQDPSINLDYLRSVTWANLWCNEIKIMEGCGHSPFMNNPQKFNQLLAEFVKSIEGS